MGDRQHAYLIMAHTNTGQLKTLLSLLDHPQNDIFIHFDKKAGAIDEGEISGVLKHSRFTWLPRRKVSWGGYSQIACELDLLEAATREEHAYYHLISGLDLPLVTQDEVHAFFKKHAGTEFLAPFEETFTGDTFPEADRIRYYHFLVDHIGRETSGKAWLLRRVENASLLLQRFLGVNRIKHVEGTFAKGSSWFSITHGFACYAVSQRERIRKVFTHSLCADELFMYKLALDSHLTDRLFDAETRYMDWDRGRPYTFCESDLQELTSLGPEKLFARKFDVEHDARIVSAMASWLQDRDPSSKEER